MPNTSGATEMVDSVKAANNANFKTTKAQLITIVEAYRQRKYVEDIGIIVNELNGSVGLLESLNTDSHGGISAVSLNARD